MKRTKHPRRGASRDASRPPHLLFAALSLGCFVAYRMLAPEGSGFGDSSELTLALWANGIAHPTGYPLYTWLGHGFVVLAHALGASWPAAAAAWSAVGASLALYFLQLLAWELSDSSGDVQLRTLLAAGTGLAFAFHPAWLSQATQAEVYSWHVAWGVATALCFARTFGTAGITLRGAVLWGLLFGVGLAHHRTSILFAGPLSIVWLVHAARRTALARVFTACGVAVLAALVPLASYGWVAWRAFHPAVEQWPVLDHSWPAVWAHVTGREFRSYLGRFAPDPGIQALLVRWVYPALAVGFMGLLFAWFRARRAQAAKPAGSLRAEVLFALLLAALVATAATFAYGVPDPDAYFLLPMAIGTAGLAPALGSIRMRRVALVSAPALVLLSLLYFWIREGIEFRNAIQNNNGVVRDMWQALPGDSAIVLWPSDAHRKLREFQRFDGEKPALFATNPSLLGYPAPRRDFLARFGVDPIADLPLERIRAGSAQETEQFEQLYAHITANVNRQTHLPVFYMDPEKGILTRLPKPGGP